MQTYRDRITDLIGLRALHLFKEDWRSIHDFVVNTWDLHEQPIAFVREGDADALVAAFRAADCEVRQHNFGYRSVHYLLKFQPDKRTYLAELQVRTIFEEGWSEIDHCVRYPRHSSDEHLADFLAIFNRLAGSADEMGSFIKNLSRFIVAQTKKTAIHERQIADIQEELRSAISELKIKEEEKKKLQDHADRLNASLLSNKELGLSRAASAASAWSRTLGLSSQPLTADPLSTIRMRNGPMYSSDAMLRYRMPNSLSEEIEKLAMMDAGKVTEKSVLVQNKLCQSCYQAFESDDGITFDSVCKDCRRARGW